MQKTLVIGVKVENIEKEMSGPQKVFNSIVNDIDNEDIIVLGRDIRACIKGIFSRDVSNLHIFGFTRSNALLVIIGKILRKNILYTANGLVSRENLHFSNQRISCKMAEFITLKLADGIICVSEGLKEMIISDYKIPKKKLKVIPNGVSEKFLTIKPDKNIFNELIPLEKRKKIIFTACGTFKYKGIEQLVKVVNDIKRDDFILVIAGPKGNVHDKVMNMMDPKKVIYIGNLNQSELISAYYYSNLYIQNSLYETFGLAPLEALAVGTPVIVSKDVQMNYLLKNTRLEHFIINNDEELSERINLILDNPNIKEDLSISAKKIAQNNTWQDIRQQYKELWSVIN
ncbi:glycosyltransferase family 4 protein [Bacillus cereus]|uniref:glycosyltransferase family 4 protein n=1 Tax=Bacillus cereus TaxID=1396 RepID=UPI000B4B39F9|nr:glycosyltransferase family 4 protein [Bacillus cereus]